MIADPSYPSNPQAIAEVGLKIYKEKFQTEYEKTHLGSFAAIDVVSQLIYVADTPEKALKDGKDADPNGFFHLIKIGSAGAFRVSYSSHNANNTWLFR